MISDPPIDFDLEYFSDGIYFFQSWDLFTGITIDGPKSVKKTLEKLEFPADLSGKRVLEIAPWNGFFAFECARRGAEQVISIGPEDPVMTGFDKTRDILGIDNVIYIRDTVYNIEKYKLGKFDIILFLGVIYHLRHPLLVLDMLYEHSSDLIFVDSPTIDTGGLIIHPESSSAPSEKTHHFRWPSYQKSSGITSKSREEIFKEHWSALQNYPILYLSNEDERRVSRDVFNWFLPNERSLRDFVTSSGFIIESFLGEPAFAFIKARKGERNFTPGFEGFNPGVCAVQSRIAD